MPGLSPGPAERGAARLAKAEAVHAKAEAEAAARKFEIKKKGKPAVTLEPKRLKQSGQAFNTFAALIPDNEWAMALSDLGYFSKVGSRFGRGDTIELVNDSFTKLAVCRVLAVNVHGGQVDLHLLQQHDLPPSRLSHKNPDDVFEIRDGGLESGWQIIRKADGAMMGTGLKNYDAALIERRNLHVTDLNRL
jgi:hypothetical protein